MPRLRVPAWQPLRQDSETPQCSELRAYQKNYFIVACLGASLILFTIVDIVTFTIGSARIHSPEDTIDGPGE